MKKLILIMLVAFGFSFNASAQKDLLMISNSYGNTRDTLDNTETIYFYTQASSATQSITAQFDLTKISGTVAPTITPVVSNNGTTWHTSNLVVSTSAGDSITWVGTNLTGTTTRTFRFPIGYKFVGFKFVGTGTMSAYITARAYIK